MPNGVRNQLLGRPHGSRMHDGQTGDRDPLGCLEPLTSGSPTIHPQELWALIANKQEAYGYYYQQSRCSGERLQRALRLPDLINVAIWAAKVRPCLRVVAKYIRDELGTMRIPVPSLRPGHSQLESRQRDTRGIDSTDFPSRTPRTAVLRAAQTVPTLCLLRHN